MNKYLIFFGFHPIFKKNNSTAEKTNLKEIIVEIANGKVRKKENKKKIIPIMKYLYNIINLLIPILILCIIIFPIIYAIIRAISDKDIRYVTGILFRFLFIFQYIFGYTYYKKNNYKKMIKRIHDYKYILKIGLICSTILSIVISLITIILLIKESDVNIFSDEYNKLNLTTQIIIGIAIFINTYFSYNIFLINLLVFAYIFLIHSLYIKKYTDKLKKYINNNTDELTITSIINEYSKLKAQYTKSVKNINNIFSSIIIIGVISGYFMIVNYNTKFFNKISYIEIICFLIISIIYIYSINNIKQKVSDIITIINSPKFSEKFLSRVILNQIKSKKDKLSKEKTLKDITKILSNKSKSNKKNTNLIKDIAFRNMIKSHENAESLDWLILMDKLNSNWEAFKLFGFDIEDATIIKKIIAIIVGLVMILNLNDIIKV